MQLEEFEKSLNEDKPPKEISAVLKSLWYDGKGNWYEAHEIAQDIPGANGAWIHAYLHRKEGDIWNADYWYRRAGVSRPNMLLSEEWLSLVKHFLGLKG